ncbi:hypothetical protein TRVL_04041 [Trypanosoma vivax]|nr:hypothetical protein TRVL_04041 [Trypanosoma vivax]
MSDSADAKLMLPPSLGFDSSGDLCAPPACRSMQRSSGYSVSGASVSPIGAPGTVLDSSITGVAPPSYRTPAWESGTEDHSRGGNSHSDPEAMASGGNSTQDGERWIWVLDPLTRKLRVPLSKLVQTQATATTGTVPSLCISFLEGRCRHHWCRQAHVQPSAIMQLRHDALHAPTCCRVHDDPHDTSLLTNTYKYIRIVNGAGNECSVLDSCNDQKDLIPTDRVAQTVGLLRFITHYVSPPKGKGHQGAANDKNDSQSEGVRETREDVGKSPNIDEDRCCANDSGGESRDDVLDLPAKLICRLHLAHRCRYLEDCNNIHICREYELRLQPPPQMVAALSAITPATRIATVCERRYTVTMLSDGEVTDGTFRMICDQQRQSVLPLSSQSQQSCSGPRQKSESVSSLEAGAPPFVLESAVQPNDNSNANNRNCVFTTRSEGARSHANSPTLGAIPHGAPIPVSHNTPQQVARVLRIYDVRPRGGQGNASTVRGADNTSSCSNNNNNGSSNGTNTACSTPYLGASRVGVTGGSTHGSKSGRDGKRNSGSSVGAGSPKHGSRGVGQQHHDHSQRYHGQQQQHHYHNHHHHHHQSSHSKSGKHTAFTGSPVMTSTQQ